MVVLAECERALARLIPVGTKNIIVALSGGLDSTVLLDCAAKIIKLPMSVLHINHQLSDHADDWELCCREKAADYDLPYISESVTVTPQGNGLESAARQARYRVFEKVCQPDTAILLAHHADDQVETVLQRILRGTGIDGLCGIPDVRALGAGHVVRPLLSIKRTALEAYAKQYQLDYVTDESNLDQNYTRNLLRHTILPMLKQHFPSADDQLLTLQANCKDTSLVTKTLIKRYYDMHGCPEHLNLDLPDGIKNAVIRYWLCEVNGLPAPSRAWLAKLDTDVICAGKDRQPELVLGDNILRRHNSALYLIPKIIDKPAPTSWNITTLHDDIKIVEGQGGVLLPTDAVVDIKYRQGGESFHPHGESGSRPLKKWLQAWQIPPWLRDQVPLIYYQNELIMVAGFAVAKNVYTEDCAAINMLWQKSLYDPPAAP